MGRRAKDNQGTGGAPSDPGDETTGALTPGDNGPLGLSGNETGVDPVGDDPDGGNSGGVGSDGNGAGDNGGPGGDDPRGGDAGGGDGRNNGRPRRGRPRGTGSGRKAPASSSNLVSSDDTAASYTLATCMLSDFLAEVLDPAFQAEVDKCEDFAEALDNMLKLPKYKPMRKSVDTIIGPLMLLSATGALFGPGVKSLIQKAQANNERKKAIAAPQGRRQQPPTGIPQGASIPASNPGPAHEDGGGSGDFAYSEIGFTGPEDGYF